VVFVLTVLLALTGARPSAEHANGQQIVRFDTYGEEQLWTDVLRMHEVVAALDPSTALDAGLNVDVDTLPPAVIAALRAKTSSGEAFKICHSRTDLWVRGVADAERGLSYRGSFLA
jgi:hypothetical protein